MDASAVCHCGFFFFLSCISANTTRIFEGTRIVKTGMVSLREAAVTHCYCLFTFYPAESSVCISIISPCMDKNLSMGIKVTVILRWFRWNCNVFYFEGTVHQNTNPFGLFWKYETHFQIEQLGDTNISKSMHKLLKIHSASPYFA